MLRQRRSVSIVASTWKPHLQSGPDSLSLAAHDSCLGRCGRPVQGLGDTQLTTAPVFCCDPLQVAPSPHAAANIEFSYLAFSRPLLFHCLPSSYYDFTVRAAEPVRLGPDSLESRDAHEPSCSRRASTFWNQQLPEKFVSAPAVMEPSAVRLLLLISSPWHRVNAQHGLHRLCSSQRTSFSFRWHRARRSGTFRCYDLYNRKPPIV